MFKIFLPLLAGLLLVACAAPQPDPRFTKPVPVVKPMPVKPAVPAYVAPPPQVSASTELENRVWQLVELTKSSSTSQIQDGAFLNFQSAGLQLKGSTGCNRLMGRYALDGNSLKLNDIASTKMFCPGGGIVQEAMFIEALTDTRSWRIDGLHLYLLDDKSDKVAVFELR